MMTDFRKLCKELVQAWDEHGGCGIPYHEACWSLAVDKVRKVLDEVVEEGPTDEEILRFIDELEPKPIPMTRRAHKTETYGVVDGTVTYDYYPGGCIKGNLQTTADGNLRWVYTEYLNRFDGDDRSIEVDATSEILELARYCNKAATTVETVGPTDEEWDALVENVWDNYETVGHQGERFMYDSDFGNALELVRKELSHYSKGEK
jgi:hypothetical protein